MERRARLNAGSMRCPSCDEKISDSAWMCPHCEHIVDASFLGNDITNDLGWDGVDSETSETIEPRSRQPTRDLKPQTRDLVVPPDPPTDGLDVEQQMIVASLDDDDDIPAEPPTDDLGPIVKEVRALGPPKGLEDKIDTKPLPDEILPNSGLRPLDPSLLQEIDEPPELAEPAPMMIAEPKKRGLPALKKNEPAEDLD